MSTGEASASGPPVEAWPTPGDRPSVVRLNWGGLEWRWACSSCGVRCFSGSYPSDTASVCDYWQDPGDELAGGLLLEHLASISRRACPDGTTECPWPA